MSADAVIIIPARVGSSRFPGKVLANETGMPLVEHVRRQAAHATRCSRVVVAADDRRIVDALRPFGAEVVMTSLEHPNGASRVAEAASILELADDAIVINAQGDEPELDPGLIDAVVEALDKPGAPPMATVASPFTAGESLNNENIVKVVVDLGGNALYFSRARIPHDASGSGLTPLKHVGLYGYRRWFLREYQAWEPTPLERAERLEQLRVLEHGGTIAVVMGDAKHAGVDTPEQYRAFVERFRGA